MGAIHMRTSTAGMCRPLVKQHNVCVCDVLIKRILTLQTQRGGGIRERDYRVWKYVFCVKNVGARAGATRDDMEI